MNVSINQMMDTAAAQIGRRTNCIPAAYDHKRMDRFQLCLRKIFIQKQPDRIKITRPDPKAMNGLLLIPLTANTMITPMRICRKAIIKSSHNFGDSVFRQIKLFRVVQAIIPHRSTNTNTEPRMMEMVISELDPPILPPEDTLILSVFLIG